MPQMRMPRRPRRWHRGRCPRCLPTTAHSIASRWTNWPMAKRRCTWPFGSLIQGPLAPLACLWRQACLLLATAALMRGHRRSAPCLSTPEPLTRRTASLHPKEAGVVPLPSPQGRSMAPHAIFAAPSMNGPGRVVRCGACSQGVDLPKSRACCASHSCRCTAFLGQIVALCAACAPVFVDWLAWALPHNPCW